MRRSGLAAMIGAIALAGSSGPPAASAQTTSGLSGQWTLNRALSEFPREIGFTPDWMRSSVDREQAGSAGGRGGGRRGGGSSSGAARPFASRPESADDARRVQLLTAEVRDPPSHVTIAEIPGAVTITTDQAQARTFHPGSGEEVLHLGDLPLRATARWEAGQLVIVYEVEEGHQLRYAYSTSADPRRLRVDVKFVERDGGDSVGRVYEPGIASEPQRNVSAPVIASGAPARSQQEPVQPPGLELKGLTKLGVVVEDLDPKAAGCGLDRHAIETAVSKTMANAGLQVALNSDEDTYVYVNVMTNTMAAGFCVSRYDVSLFTNTTATLSYQTRPALVQVSLLHKGGFAGGGASTHAAGVLQGVTQYAEQFAAQIRDANR